MFVPWGHPLRNASQVIFQTMIQLQSSMFFEFSLSSIRCSVVENIFRKRILWHARFEYIVGGARMAQFLL